MSKTVLFNTNIKIYTFTYYKNLHVITVFHRNG